MPPTLIDSYSLSPIIGIGTHTPNESLTVVGNTSASGTVYGDSGSFNSVSAVNIYGTGTIQADSVTDTHGGTLVKKKSFTIVGNGVSQQFTLNHNFNTYETLVQVYEYDTKEAVMCYIKSTNVNNTLIDVGTSITAGVSAYLVVIFC